MSNNILIIDDEKIFAKLLSLILVENGFNVKIAHSVRQAFTALKNFKPDVVLLDVKLPHGNEGLDFLTRFRNMPSYSQTPVIILSAKVQLHEVNAGIEAGASLYLCKPALIEDVIRHIKNYL